MSTIFNPLTTINSSDTISASRSTQIGRAHV